MAYVSALGQLADAFDPELGAACNCLAAFADPLPEGIVIDVASRLTERDLALILRRLYDTRHSERSDDGSDEATTTRVGRASIPITASRITH